MHKRRSDKLFDNKCPIVNCHSTFQFPGSLETHLRYHKNDIDECQFCPYRYIDPKSYKSHLRTGILSRYDIAVQPFFTKIPFQFGNPCKELIFE